MATVSTRSHRTVIAPAPSPATTNPLPNRVLSVILDADEDVQWTWSSTTDGVSYVSGYTLVKRANHGDGAVIERPQAVSKLLEETDRVIVTEWQLAPGAETGWHRHSRDYVVVCLTAGTLLAETPAGNVETQLRFGQSYARPLGVEHNIVNSGVEQFAFVEIELK